MSLLNRRRTSPRGTGQPLCTAARAFPVSNSLARLQGWKHSPQSCHEPEQEWCHRLLADHRSLATIMRRKCAPQRAINANVNIIINIIIISSSSIIIIITNTTTTNIIIIIIIIQTTSSAFTFACELFAMQGGVELDAIQENKNDIHYGKVAVAASFVYRNRTRTRYHFLLHSKTFVIVCDM
jgi:hypothetical protein